MRIVIGEDQVLLREGLARLVAEEGHEVVGSAGDGPDLVRKAMVASIFDDLGLPPTADGHRRVLAVIRYLDRSTS